MKTISVEAVIQASPEEVFETASNIASTPRWQPAVKRVEMLTEGEPGEGTRWKETRATGKKDAVVEMHISQWDPPVAFTVVSEMMHTKYSTVFTFEPVEGGTRAALTCYIDPHDFFAKVMSGMSEASVKAALEDDIQRLKRAVESRPR